MLSFVECSHQPFSRPMATVLSCCVVDYQDVVIRQVFPSVLFPSDGHGIVLLFD